MGRILRDLKRGELTIKDMGVLRESASAKNQSTKNYGDLKEYTLNHKVSMSWGFSGHKGVRPFVLRIDDKHYTLSWLELKEMDRAGFFRRESGNPSSYTLRYIDGPRVTIDTELNDEAKRDMIFRLTTKEAECYLDWYEVLRLGRFI